MANEELYLLNEIYERYIEEAKKYEVNGNFSLAKKYYENASRSMKKIAEQSTGNLRDIRFKRAEDLLERANKMEINEENASLKDENEDQKKWDASEKTNIHFSDIAGMDDVKNIIKIQMILPFIHPDVYKIYKKKTGGGVLLYGPPGCGKTMFAKAVACEVDATFFHVKSSDIVSKWVGESEQNINSLFQTAIKCDKAVIFIDEVDALFAKRGEDTYNDKRVNEFLQQMDGFSSKNEKILIIGATNRPWDIDNAALRSGRFSKKIFIPLPDVNARLFLFKKNLTDIPIDEMDFDLLVEKTKGFSCADIVEVIDSAKNRAIQVSIEKNIIGNITKEDILLSIENVGKNVNKNIDLEYINYSNNCAME